MSVFKVNTEELGQLNISDRMNANQQANRLREMHLNLVFLRVTNPTFD